MNFLLHIITDFITDLFGSLAAKKIGDAAKDAATKAVKMDSEQAKRKFPENSMRESHQVRFGGLADKLDDGLEKALEEYFLSKLGENQRADFIIHMAEWAEQDEKAALRFLIRLAKRAGSDQADFDSMVRMAVSNDYMKPNETNYPAGWVMNWFGTHNIAQLLRQIGWKRGLALVFLIWGLLRSKPEDFLNAFTRIQEIFAELIGKGVDKSAAVATAVFQGTREALGFIGTVAIWPFRTGLAVVCIAIGSLLVILSIAFAVPGLLQSLLTLLAVTVAWISIAALTVWGILRWGWSNE